MSNIWFTSDTHFQHKNIIRLSNRPFESVQEHDEVLIENWNRKVKKDDLVYHLGDFIFGPVTEGEKILSKLNGKKILIRGNHDHNGWKCKGWVNKHDVLQLRNIGPAKGIVLFHYPIMEWAGAFRENYHFFGHVHGQIPANSHRCDVGVDAWNYEPVNIEEIISVLNTKPQYNPQENYK